MNTAVISRSIGKAGITGIMLICTPAISLPTPTANAAFEETLTAENVIERARISRVEFSNVLFELRSSIPDIGTKDKIAPFLGILDELKNIQTELNFAAFDSEMVTELASRLTTHVEPQLNILEDDDALLINFSRWAEDVARTQFCEHQRTALLRTKTSAEVIEINRKIAAITNALKLPLPRGGGAPPLMDDFIKLQASSVRRLVDAHFRETTIEQYRILLASIEKPGALEQGLEGMTQLAYVSQEGEDLEKATLFLLTTRAHLQEMPPESFPDTAIAATSAAISMVMLKIIDQGVPVSVDVGLAALDALSPQHVDALGAGISSLQPSSHPPSQFKLLAILTGRIARHFERFGMRSQQKNMQGLAGQFALGAKVDGEDFEGIYRITIGGNDGYFSFARIDNTDVVAAIGYRHLAVSMAHSTFDAESGEFVSSSFQDGQPAPDGGSGQPEVPAQVANYRLFKNEAPDAPLHVTGTLRIGGIEQDFSGQRILAFQDFMKPDQTRTGMATPIAPTPVQSGICGDYTGKWGNYNALLKVSKLGQKYTATMVLSPESTATLVPFDLVHLFPPANALYLTSRQRTSFLQLRGLFEEDRFDGWYIVGGKPHPVETSFVKIPGQGGCQRLLPE